MELGTALLLAKMPNWYQELSNRQEKILENLHTMMRHDALELYCPQTSKFLDILGIYPPLSVLQITSCLDTSDYRPIQFLKYVAELLGRRQGDKLPGKEYSANERLVYTAICQLLYPDLIRKLDFLLPNHKKEIREKPENLRYMTLPPKKITASPYLNVPELLLKKKQLAIQHNKMVKEKRKPYLQLLTKVSYKQDIINEIINNEIVCDEKLKYLYQRGIHEFDILRNKFHALEDKRKELELKLYPDKKFIAKNLKYETFEMLRQSKMKKKKVVLKSDSDLTNSSLSIISSRSVSIDGSSMDIIHSDSSLAVNPVVVKHNFYKNRKYQNKMNIYSAEVTTNETGSRVFENGRKDNSSEAPRDLGSPVQKSAIIEAEVSDDSGFILRSEMDASWSSKSDIISQDRSAMFEFMSDGEFQRELVFMKPKYQLEAALKYLSYKNKNLSLIPFLKYLPKLKIWYEKRQWSFKKQSQTPFKKLDEFHFEKRLQSIKQTKFKLPQIRETIVDKKILYADIENCKAAFTRELKLKQIDLSRELFTLYNVECLQREYEIRKFKRTFFSIFPNREKDILIK